MATNTNTSDSPPDKSRPSLPPTETLTHESQIHPFTTTIATAFFSGPGSPNPLTVAFTTEIDNTPPPYPSPTITVSRFTSHFHIGILQAFRDGATLICSPSIAAPSALAVWEPPFFKGTPFDQVRKEPGPILREWQVHTERMRRVYIPQGVGYWHLGFLARNPEEGVEKVKGAVSAVVVPVLERCKREGTVAWLEATSKRAVGVYEWYGFRVCEVVRFGVGRVDGGGWPREGGEGVEAWGMIFDWHLNGGGKGGEGGELS
jgi:hypothetical protein